MPAYRPIWIVLTLLYCSFIFYLSSQPDIAKEAPTWLDWPGSDKVAHLILYGGLGGLVAVGLHRSNGGRLRPRKIFLFAVAFAVLYGASDEIHQNFVPPRTPDVLDLLADATGATIIAGVYTAWMARAHSAPASSALSNSAD